MKYGELTLGQMEAIVNKLGGMSGVNSLLRGEFVFKQMLPKNENGHYVLSIKGRSLTDTREIDTMAGTLLGNGEDLITDESYIDLHQLENREYKAVFVPSSEVFPAQKPRDYAMSLGYQVPKAGIAPFICGMISRDLAMEMGFVSISFPHSPIKGKTLTVELDDLQDEWIMQTEEDEYCPKGQMLIFVVE